MSRSLDLPKNLLAGKTNAELTRLSEDNSKLVEFFSSLTLQEIENTKKKKEELANENKQLAGNTYSLKSRFESLKASLTDRSLEAAVQKAEYEKRFAELKNLSQNDRASILKALQEAKKTEEQRSEGLVDGFLSGKQSSSPEEFVQLYLASRKLYWLRKTKADKLTDQIKSMSPKPAPRSSRTGSSILPISKSTPQDLPNPQGQPPYQPTASLPPALLQPSNKAPPTQSLPYGRPPPPQPTGYPSPPSQRPYGPPPPVGYPGYPPPGTYHPAGYPPAPYQSIGNQPPPRPQSQPYPYPVYHRPPY
ncbi:hypothetical protein EMCRGX_G023989 [Ephydatia muelleri]|eukprot:Em0015g229a